MSSAWSTISLDSLTWDQRLLDQVDLGVVLVENIRKVSFSWILLRYVMLKLAFYYFLCYEEKCTIWLQMETPSCVAWFIHRAQRAL